MKGATLPELLVSIAIILIMAAIVLNWRAGDETLEAGRAVRSLAQDLRRVQELTLRAQELPPGQGCAEGLQLRGYGMFLDEAEGQNRSYTLFADCNGDSIWSAGDVLVEEVALENEVRVDNLSPSSTLNIFFVPPDPEVWINGGQITDIAQIDLVSSQGGVTRSLTVNRRGVVSIVVP